MRSLFLLSFFAFHQISLAADPDLQCKVKEGKNYKYAVPAYKGKIQGEYYFHNLESCEKAVAAAYENYVCVSADDSDAAALFKYPNLGYFGEEISANIDECLKSLDKLKAEFSAVRLDDPGGSMEFVRARDQGPYPICSSELAAQISDVIRFKGGDTNHSFQASGWMIATDVSVATKDYEFDEGATVSQAVDAVRTRGSVCDKSFLIESLSEAQATKFLESLKLLRTASINFRDENLSLKDFREQEKSTLNEIQALLPAACLANPEVKLPEFDAISQIFRTIDPDHQFQAVMNEFCRANKINLDIPPMVWQSAKSLKEDAIVSKLLGLIQSPKSLPVAVKYCGNSLVDGDKGKECTDHAVLVMGKRLRLGQRQFLLRNSWGMQCGGHTRWECDQKGNVWVSADAVAKNIKGFYLIKGEQVP